MGLFLILIDSRDFLYTYIFLKGPSKDRLKVHGAKILLSKKGYFIHLIYNSEVIIMLYFLAELQTMKVKQKILLLLLI